jgi:PhnB protein
MAQLNPYLTFNGNCETAFKFYRSVFGGEFQQIMRFKDMPPMPGQEIRERDKERIMHVALPISKETILMGSDSNPNMGEFKGQNVSLSVITSSKEEANKIFARLSEGGKVTMPLADQVWNSYFGMVTDLFQTTWMISYDYPKKD